MALEGLGADRWVVASLFAAVMLPGLFPRDDVLGRLELAREDLVELEGMLDGIPVEVFTSDDGLGWVYQFWQSRRKDEVNASEVKIGARELPAVTQLFTEHYMVRFLLENSLGAWWAGIRSRRWLRRLSISGLMMTGILLRVRLMGGRVLLLR